MNEWMSVIINDKTIYVYEPLTMCNACLRKWDESYAWENTTPAIELIELIITDGVIISVNDFKEAIEKIVSLYDDGMVLLCSNDKTDFFICFLKTERKGEFDRIGAIKFVIPSNENNHLGSPHFHVIFDGSKKASFDFNGDFLCGIEPKSSLRKLIKTCFENTLFMQKAKDEWNRNKNNVKV